MSRINQRITNCLSLIECGKILNEMKDLKAQLRFLITLDANQIISTLASAEESTRTSILEGTTEHFRNMISYQIVAFQVPKSSPFVSIPQELKAMIFDYLSINSLKAISTVCHSLHDSVAQTLFNTLTICLYKDDLEHIKQWLDPHHGHTYRHCLRVLRFKFPCRGRKSIEEICGLLEKVQKIGNKITIILESGNVIRLFPRDYMIGKLLLVDGKNKGFKLSLEHFNYEQTSTLLQDIMDDNRLLSLESLRIPIHSTKKIVEIMPSIRVENLAIDTSPNMSVDALLRVTENIKEPKNISIDGCSFDEPSLQAGNWPSLSSYTLRSWNTEIVAWYSSQGSIKYINMYSIDEKTRIYLLEPWPASPEYTPNPRDQVWTAEKLNTDIVIDEIAWINNDGCPSNIYAAYVVLDWCYTKSWEWEGREVNMLPEVKVRVIKASGGTKWATLFEVCKAVGENRVRSQLRQMLEVRLDCWEDGTGMQLGMRRHIRYDISRDLAYSGAGDPTPNLT